VTTTTPNRIDAQPTRDHIRSLHAAGFTDRRIAALAGLAPETVIGFTRTINRAGNRKGIKRRCQPDVAAKILAVVAEEAAPGCVDSTGTKRRVQALVAQGWPMQQVARHVGISGNHMRLLMTRDRLYGRTAKTVADVYERLRNKRPERNGIATWEAKKARDRAAARSWPTPRYWAQHADGIDDPHFEPLYGVTRRERIAQDANWVMRTVGLSKADTAARLGVDKSYIEHAFRDHPQYAIEVAA
jgi:hypothetical protein